MEKKGGSIVYKVAMDDRTIYALLCRPYLLSACTAKSIADSMKQQYRTLAEHLYAKTHIMLTFLSQGTHNDDPISPLTTPSVLQQLIHEIYPPLRYYFDFRDSFG